jgi:hypothetical protein
MVILLLELATGLTVGVDSMGVPVTSAKSATLALLDHVTGRQSSAVANSGKKDKEKESTKRGRILNDSIFEARGTQLLGLGLRK